MEKQPQCEDCHGWDPVDGCDDQNCDVYLATKPVYRYTIGMGRNEGEQYGRSHLYAQIRTGEYGSTYLPMCMYGWNRSDGESLSILRGHIGGKGICKICQRRKDAGLRPVPARVNSHKTKWL